MAKKLYLLDGMALVYRAHFALIRSPIFTSNRFNTSAIYGFTNTLLDILKSQQPSHLAVVFDTAAPTARHETYKDYKAQRQEMPEELSAALPHVKRIIEGFRIPVLSLDGFEADDIIGTLARRAEKEGYDTFMVTPDKDFGQLLTEHIFIYKPGRMGSDSEILGVPQILERWGIGNVGQVVDILGLMGDASDNIPGIPGFGEKTAAKLIGQFGSVENLIASAEQLKGKQKELVETHKDQALLSKKLAAIITDVPLDVPLDSLQLQDPDEAVLKSLFTEFEFNTLGRRLFGEEFKAGRGAAVEKAKAEGDLFALEGEVEGDAASSETALAGGADLFHAHLKRVGDVAHTYRIAATPKERAELVAALKKAGTFCFDTETTSLNPKTAQFVGLSFALQPHEAFYVPVPEGENEARAVLEEFRAVLEDPALEKTGHNLKFDLSVLHWHGIAVRGKLFDTMLAHALIEPELRHGMDFLSESYLGYSPISIVSLIGEKGEAQQNMRTVPLEKIAEYAAEDADVTLQLRAVLEPLLKQKGQERVFYDIECPLVPVLVKMEAAGVAVDTVALAEISAGLAKQIVAREARIFELAGTTFNLNSPKQLGQVLFEILKLEEKPKKTKTGQYVTNEQVLESLAARHEIARTILEYREATKLKTTYVDTLPGAVFPKTGRVHTTYNQAVTTTGRMQSQNPNLQNIPVRSEQGREIRKAFVPQGAGFVLLAADYSQIELRVMAELSGDEGMREAFQSEDTDIHAATAAKVYGVAAKDVTADMRRNAKMVNFGIIYGISAFGLAQRLGIPRAEAAGIIEQYFIQYPGVKKYMADTVAFCRLNGYVETVTGRRRYLRDITSANMNIRQAAERNAINAPIQGTAADMIKLAMSRVQEALEKGNYKTRMLLQVHDELVFELWEKEKKDVLPIVEHAMKTAIPMKVPILVEMGTGKNWLEAH
jgi:DNA polymerase-1